MFTRTTLYSNDNKLSINRFIESINGIDDIANSTLLMELDDQYIVNEYIITKYEHRIDLISKDIYGSVDYSWILLYYNRLTIGELVRGARLYYLDKADINNLISQLH